MCHLYKTTKLSLPSRTPSFTPGQFFSELDGTLQFTRSPHPSVGPNQVLSPCERGQSTLRVQVFDSFQFSTERGLGVNLQSQHMTGKTVYYLYVSANKGINSHWLQVT